VAICKFEVFTAVKVEFVVFWVVAWRGVVWCGVVWCGVMDASVSEDRAASIFSGEVPFLCDI
jgi:hypothetical protein